MIGTLNEFNNMIRERVIKRDFDFNNEPDVSYIKYKQEITIASSVYDRIGLIIGDFDEVISYITYRRYEKSEPNTYYYDYYAVVIRFINHNEFVYTYNSGKELNDNK